MNNFLKNIKLNKRQVILLKVFVIILFFNLLPYNFAKHSFLYKKKLIININKILFNNEKKYKSNT